VEQRADNVPSRPDCRQLDSVDRGADRASLDRVGAPWCRRAGGARHPAAHRPGQRHDRRHQLADRHPAGRWSGHVPRHRRQPPAPTEYRPQIRHVSHVRGDQIQLRLCRTTKPEPPAGALGLLGWGCHPAHRRPRRSPADVPASRCVGRRRTGCPGSCAQQHPQCQRSGAGGECGDQRQ
jgi:hypothetical protein